MYSIQSSCFDFRVPTTTAEGGLLLIGAGSGIAPYRGIWTERRESFGPVSMFFGFRTRSGQPYMDEIKAAVDDSLHDPDEPEWKYFPCFSREPGEEKQYVQQLLWTNKELIWARIVGGAHVYICGKPSMGLEVEETLGKIASSRGISFAEAPLFAQRLQKDGRLHKDVFTET
eukprot:SAG11_NODE_690_length_7706_cov_7.429078_4_plen_172_part_00